MSTPYTALLRQLSENSTPYRDPLAAVNWSQLDAGNAWLPEHALSLYGVPGFGELAAAVRQRLSQLEFVHVMHCGLWLESIFLQRMSRRLRPGLPRAEHEILLHELREEAGHSLMFLRAIEAAGLSLSARSWRAPRAPYALGRWVPAGSALFSLALFIGEDVSDKFNRYLRVQAEGVNPAVRQICTLHVADEARHIVLARRMLEARLTGAGPVQRRFLAWAAERLLRQMTGTFYFPPADFYERAGLACAPAWRKAALRNPVRWRFAHERLAPTMRTLQSYGLVVRI
jgi:hypothetical protein